MPKVIPNKIIQNPESWEISQGGWVFIEIPHPTRWEVYTYFLDKTKNPRMKLPPPDEMHANLNEQARNPENLTFPVDGTAPFFIFRICGVEKKVWVNQNLMPSFTHPDSFFTNQCEFEAAAKAASEAASEAK
jgi:hypothetical protein